MIFLWVRTPKQYLTEPRCLRRCAKCTSNFHLLRPEPAILFVTRNAILGEDTAIECDYALRGLSHSPKRGSLVFMSLSVVSRSLPKTLLSDQRSLSWIQGPSNLQQVMCNPREMAVSFKFVLPNFFFWSKHQFDHCMPWIACEALLFVHSLWYEKSFLFSYLIHFVFRF